MDGNDNHGGFMRTRAIAVVLFLVVLAAAFAAVKVGHGHVQPLFGFSSGA